jgi:peptidoglycan/LPS O-acetylase OafA/YrhL
MPYISAIDGLRAVAILIVLLSHLTGGKWIPGGFGVTLFFFISGYLITSLLIFEIRHTGTINIPAFYIRRVRRLAPASVAMVCVIAAIYWVAFGEWWSAELVAALLYFMNYYQLSGAPAPLPLGTLWSLAIEEHFYLIFPLVVLTFLKFRSKFFAALVMMCAVTLIWRTVLVYQGAVEYRTYIASDTRIDSILLGCILATAIDLKINLLWAKSRVALLVAGAAILLSFAIRNHAFRETVRYTVQGLAITPFFLAVLTREYRLLQQFLEHPISTWIGKISYSLYLWHFPVLVVVQRVINQPLTIFIVSAVLSFALAALSFTFIETPIRHRASLRIVEA